MGMPRKNQFPARIFTETQASCSKCVSMKIFSEFHRCAGQPHGISYWCKECANRLARVHHAHHRANDAQFKVKARNCYTKRKYGLTLEQYTDRLAAQNFECGICGKFLDYKGHNTHLDHCHKTGKLRGFLCTNCNRGLGHFQDSVVNLENAQLYLETHT